MSTRVFITLWLILSSAWSLAATATDARKPNIIFILADDLGYGDVACFNPDSKIPTPHLDRLAATGMKFTDAHAPTAVCTPTRYAILTGRYAWRTHLKAGVLWQYDKPLIEADRLTMPEMLRRQGYHTAAIGKWHLGMNWPFTSPEAERRLAKNFGDDATPADIDWTKPITGGPIARGFDSYFGVNAPNFAPYVFIENDHIVGPAPAQRVPKHVAGRLSEHSGPLQAGFDRKQIAPTMARKAVELIDRAASTPGKPFFLYLALTGPHSPILPNDAFKGKSGIGDYGDFVMEMDATVGDVMMALDRHGITKDTLILFTSDNGPENWNYEEARDFKHHAMGQLRGVKRSVWEGGHRVPFIATWPGKIQAGTTNPTTICHVDTMATCADLTGFALPDAAAEDSMSYLPALLGKEPAPGPVREGIVHHGADGRLAIRKGRWVFIDAKNGGGGEPDWFRKERGYVAHTFPGELYDLASDPSQRVNLYGEQPALVKELKALLEKYRADGRSVPHRQAKPPGA